MYSAWHVMSTQYFLLKKLLIIEVQTKLLGAQQVSREHLGEVREITNSTWKQTALNWLLSVHG